MKIAAIIVGFDYWYSEGHKDDFFTHRFAHAVRDYNPDIKVLVVDNASKRPYTATNLEILRLDKRVGYGEALNAGIEHLTRGAYDWYICLNNDCVIVSDGNLTKIIQQLDENVLYGSGWNKDDMMKIDFQWSAWLVISQKIMRKVGLFDVRLSAAFEDFDYEKRTLDAGFTLNTAALPIAHLDKHTRLDDKAYAARWEEARQYFELKHGLPTRKWFTDKEIKEANAARNT